MLKKKDKKIVLEALKKGWERWEMKMLRGDCEKGWEIRDEDGGLWWGVVRKVEGWEMKMGGLC